MQDERFGPVHAALVRLLTALDLDHKDPNLKGTPQRVAEWLLEKFPSEAADKAMLKELARAYFPTDYDGMLAQTDIRVYGLCPHHFKDVMYTIAVGYVPKGRAIGLSKLTRISEFCLGRATLQEDGTADLATTLQEVLATENVAVVVKGRHYCMVSRGVKQHNTMTTTAEMRGLFRKDESGIKSEFLQLVHGSK